MAAGADTDPDAPKVIVDAPRLARVAVWPSSWTPGMSVEEVERELSLARPELTLTGRRLQLRVDNDVSGDHNKVLLIVEIVTPAGRSTSIILGPYPQGQATRSAPMTFCGAGCQVTGITISGPGINTAAMHGTLTIDDVRVDGAPLPYFTRVGWRAHRASANGATSVTGTRVTGSSLRVELDSRGKKVVAVLAPRDVPAVLPVLVGRTATPEVADLQGNALTLATSEGVKARVRPVSATESAPFLGPAAMVVDYTTYTRANSVNDDLTNVQILARSDTPQGVLDQLAAHGVGQPVTLQEVRQALDHDPYALALNLYLVVTVTVLLLALASLAVTMAVQIPARRRDAASLRVVGLPRRSIVSAVAAELTAVLGTAAIAGILAGALAQYVVVRTITLGYQESAFTPRLLPSLDLPTVAALLAVAFVVLTSLAVVLGGLTIRGARTATLRESAA